MMPQIFNSRSPLSEFFICLLVYGFHVMFFPTNYPRVTQGISACVTAVKCPPVIHQCAVVFGWSSRIMECMLITFERKSTAFSRGRVWSFINIEQLQQQKTVAVFTPCKQCFHKTSLFRRLIQLSIRV